MAKILKREGANPLHMRGFLYGSCVGSPFIWVRVFDNYSKRYGGFTTLSEEIGSIYDGFSYSEI